MDKKIRKIIREMVEKPVDYTQLFLDEIEKMQSYEDVAKRVYGFFGPFNPKEPFRSAFINKVKKIIEMEKDEHKNELKGILDRLEKQDPNEVHHLPPGAMY